MKMTRKVEKTSVKKLMTDAVTHLEEQINEMAESDDLIKLLVAVRDDLDKFRATRASLWDKYWVMNISIEGDTFDLVMGYEGTVDSTNLDSDAEAVTVDEIPTIYSPGIEIDENGEPIGSASIYLDWDDVKMVLGEYIYVGEGGASTDYHVFNFVTGAEHIAPA